METLDAPIPRAFLTAADASMRYGGSAHFWRKLAHSKQLPAFRVGEVLIVFKLEDVESFILGNPLQGPAPCRDGRRKGKRPGRRPGKAAAARNARGAAAGRRASAARELGHAPAESGT